MRLDDAQIIITVGMTTGITGDLGFAYADGRNHTEVPQDAAYFGAGFDLTAAKRLRAEGRKNVVLPKPAQLVLTIKGAANAKASEITVLASGELTGSL